MGRSRSFTDTGLRKKLSTSLVWFIITRVTTDYDDSSKLGAQFDSVFFSPVRHVVRGHYHYHSKSFALLNQMTHFAISVL